MNQEYINNLHKIYKKMADYYKTNEKIIFLNGEDSMELIEANIVSKVNGLLTK